MRWRPFEDRHSRESMPAKTPRLFALRFEPANQDCACPKLPHNRRQRRHSAEDAKNDAECSHSCIVRNMRDGGAVVCADGVCSKAAVAESLLTSTVSCLRFEHSIRFRATLVRIDLLNFPLLAVRVASFVFRCIEMFLHLFSFDLRVSVK